MIHHPDIHTNPHSFNRFIYLYLYDASDHLKENVAEMCSGRGKTEKKS